MNRLNNYVKLLGGSQATLVAQINASGESGNIKNMLTEIVAFPNGTNFGMELIKRKAPTVGELRALLEAINGDSDYQLATGDAKKNFFNELLAKIVITPSVATTVPAKAAAATVPAKAAATVPTTTAATVPTTTASTGTGTFKVVNAPPPDYTTGEPEINMFKVFVYRAQNKEDILIGTATANRSQTLKSVIDGVKGANPNQRCIVSNGKTFVTSLDPKDYYVTFANLKLRYDQAELTLI